MPIEIIIKDLVHKPILKNCYTMEITFIKNNEYRTLESVPFKKCSQDIIQLKEFIQICEKMKKTHKYDEFNIPGYNKWFDECYEPMNPFYFEIPLNYMDIECTIEKTYNDYQVYYYDENGNKFNTEIQIN